MQRRTITIEDFLYTELQKMRAGFLLDGRDVSFTAAVNVVLLGGLMAANRFKEDDWTMIREFLDERGQSLDLDSLTDHRADVYLGNLTRRAELTD